MVKRYPVRDIEHSNVEAVVTRDTLPSNDFDLVPEVSLVPSRTVAPRIPMVPETTVEPGPALVR